MLHGARVIGPNCLGIIIPDVCRFGSLGGPAVDCRKAFKPGIVGVMSRSGGMTTEICNALSAAGLGESTAISVGGDPVIGSTYVDLMPFFEKDPDTKAIVIYSEPGGSSEAELARWATANKSRLPIVAFVAGRFMDEMPGMSFGHAGTVVEKKARLAGRQDPPHERGRHLGRRRDRRHPAAGARASQGRRSEGVAMAMFIRVDVEAASLARRRASPASSSRFAR